MFAIENWEESPFASDLKQDLDNLPERKRDQYLQGFERFRMISLKDLEFRNLLLTMFSNAMTEWTPEDGPFPSYLDKMTREFFPFPITINHHKV